jgi:hypothetical protein
MDTQKTAAGNIQVITSEQCPSRGNTRVFFGTLDDGRFVVSSRFEYYVVTANRQKAERKFEELCRAK